MPDPSSHPTPPTPIAFTTWMAVLDLGADARVTAAADATGMVRARIGSTSHYVSIFATPAVLAAVASDLVAQLDAIAAEGGQ